MHCVRQAALDFNEKMNVFSFYPIIEIEKFETELPTDHDQAA